jgi:hypothetical protein
MEQYQIVIGENAKKDIVNLSNSIIYDYASPITAFKYLKGLFLQINSLKSGAESFVVQTSPFFHQYGFNVRAISYKKMTIIYVVSNHCVYIKAVISSATIKGL